MCRYVIHESYFNKLQRHLNCIYFEDDPTNPLPNVKNFIDRIFMIPYKSRPFRCVKSVYFYVREVVTFEWIFYLYDTFLKLYFSNTIPLIP